MKNKLIQNFKVGTGMIFQTPQSTLYDGDWAHINPLDKKLSIV